MTVGITYSLISTVNIALGTGNDTFTVVSTNAGSTTNIPGGNGNETINVRSVAGPTFVNAGTGQSVVNVGSQAGVGGGNTGGTLVGIQGGLTINGGLRRRSTPCSSMTPATPPVRPAT